MSETDVMQIGDPMPRLAAVSCGDGYAVEVRWRDGSRTDLADVVDLAPVLLVYKSLRPLRDNPDLLRTVHLVDGGAAIGWGDDDVLQVAATTIERLAEEAMSTGDFRAWLDRNKLSFDSAAAKLGISRRLVAYYASSRDIPRYIALACRYLDTAERGEPTIAA